MKVQSRELISERLIGKGTSSIVYETTWGGRSFARKDFLGVPKDVFEEEAKALVDLNFHRNVVKTYCWTVDEESCSLVTDLMDDDLHSVVQRRMAAERKKLNPGGSGSSGASQATSHVIDLQQFMEDRKKASVATSSESVASPPIYPFSMQEALHIMRDISRGMEFLHAKGVVHGDLKPKNAFVGPSHLIYPSIQFDVAQVRVADFGLLGTKMKSRALVSRQARKLDTVRWRAGELFNSSFLTEDEDDSSTDSEDWDSDSGKGESSVVHKYEVPTKYSDVYSFGLTCSQILTGEDPYSGLGLHDLVKNIRDPDGLRPELPPTCPIRLRKLIESCWSENYSRPSFESIVSDLGSIILGSMADFDEKSEPLEGPLLGSMDDFDEELVLLEGPLFGSLELDNTDILQVGSRMSMDSGNLSPIREAKRERKDRVL